MHGGIAAASGGRSGSRPRQRNGGRRRGLARGVTIAILITTGARSSTDRVADFESEGCRLESYPAHFDRRRYIPPRAIRGNHLRQCLGGTSPASSRQETTDNASSRNVRAVDALRRRWFRAIRLGHCQCFGPVSGRLETRQDRGGGLDLDSPGAGIAAGRFRPSQATRHRDYSKVHRRRRGGLSPCSRAGRAVERLLTGLLPPQGQQATIGSAMASRTRLEGSGTPPTK